MNIIWRFLTIGVGMLLVAEFATARTADTYNPAFNQLTIPKLSAYGKTYTNVVITVGKVLSVNGPTVNIPFDSYDPATNRLTIVSVISNGSEYSNVIVTVNQVLGVAGVFLPVAKTGYENKINYTQKFAAQYGRLITPNIYDSPPIAQFSDEQGFETRAIAYADFEHNGTLGAITISTRYTNAFPGNNLVYAQDSPGRVYILRRNNGAWIDISSQLIDESSTRFTCVTSTFVQISDFNNDDRPDAVISCTGIDFMLNGQWTSDLNSLQYIVMSQPNGKYVVRPIGTTKIYGHQLAAADVDNDGNADILAVDPGVTGHPIVYWGNGDGTFSEDLSNRFPSDTQGKNIYGILVFILSGITPGADASGTVTSRDYGTKIFTFENGKFQQKIDLTRAIPTVPGKSHPFLFMLDVVIKENILYAEMDDITNVQGIVRIDLSTLNGLNVYSGTGYRIGDSITMINGNIVNFISNCGNNSILKTDFFYEKCSFSVAM
jgi:hypothetical protein